MALTTTQVPTLAAGVSSGALCNAPSSFRVKQRLRKYKSAAASSFVAQTFNCSLKRKLIILQDVYLAPQPTFPR